MLTPRRRDIENVAAVYDRRTFSPILKGLESYSPGLACQRLPWVSSSNQDHGKIASTPTGLDLFEVVPRVTASPQPWAIRLQPFQGCPSFGERRLSLAAKPGTETSPDIDVEEKLKEAFARGWSVIVWNDPVNLMDYVVYVFKAVLKMNEKDASRHMWEVHQKGKSVVALETREKSELIVHRLRGFGLNATLEQA
jgi:ATP-dependent Clp protease adaptor protein ClpS